MSMTEKNPEASKYRQRQGPVRLLLAIQVKAIRKTTHRGILTESDQQTCLWATSSTSVHGPSLHRILKVVLMLATLMMPDLLIRPPKTETIIVMVASGDMMTDTDLRIHIITPGLTIKIGTRVALPVIDLRPGIIHQIPHSRAIHPRADLDRTIETVSATATMIVNEIATETVAMTVTGTGMSVKPVVQTVAGVSTALRRVPIKIQIQNFNLYSIHSEYCSSPGLKHPYA